MRVLLTRPHASARRLSARLRAAGHETVLSPVIEIVATHVVPQSGRADAIVATSANAFVCLADEAVKALNGLPLFVVGEAASMQAQARGFAMPRVVAATARDLAAAIATREETARAFLYLAGRDRKPDLENALRSAGHRVEAAIVYEARAATALHADVATALREGGIDAVLHFSRRSAALFRQLAATAGLEAAANSVLHVCISADAANALTGVPAQNVRVAAAPDSEHMLVALSQG